LVFGEIILTKTVIPVKKGILCPSVSRKITPGTDNCQFNTKFLITRWFEGRIVTNLILASETKRCSIQKLRPLHYVATLYSRDCQKPRNADRYWYYTL